MASCWAERPEHVFFLGGAGGVRRGLDHGKPHECHEQPASCLVRQQQQYGFGDLDLAGLVQSDHQVPGQQGNRRASFLSRERVAGKFDEHHRRQSGNEPDLSQHARADRAIWMSDALISAARYVDSANTTHQFLGGTAQSFIIGSWDINIELIVTTSAGATVTFSLTSGGVLKWVWAYSPVGAAGTFAVNAGRQIIMPSAGLVMPRISALDIRSTLTNVSQVNWEFNIYGKVVG